MFLIGNQKSDGSIYVPTKTSKDYGRSDAETVPVLEYPTGSANGYVPTYLVWSQILTVIS